MTLRSKKALHAKLFRIMQALEEASIELDADVSKTESIDRIGVILPGVVATLLMLLRSMEPEMAYEEEQRRFEEEFRRLYEEEQRRKPHLKPPPVEAEDEEPPQEMV